jgi:hypothetical protein
MMTASSPNSRATAEVVPRGKIMIAIYEAFDVDIVSEYQPEFWGFDTREAWDAAMEEMGRKQFHAEILKYLREEPHGIRRGTIGMIHAKIAKKLVKKDPCPTTPTRRRPIRHFSTSARTH